MIVGLLVGFAVASVGEARADPVSVGTAVRLSSGTGANGGGAFNVFVEPFGGAVSFVTFCLQINQFFTPGATMYVGSIAGTTSAGTAVTPGTAYLYTMFRQGTLSGYTNTGASATALQLAFWYLQGQVTGSQGGSFRNFFTGASLGMNALAWTFITMAQNSGWTGIGNVRSLNLYGSYSGGQFSGVRQAQLTLANVPEPGTLTLLLLGGALGLAGTRRRFTRG